MQDLAGYIVRVARCQKPNGIRNLLRLAETAQQIGDLTGMAQAIQGAVLMSQGKHDEALAAIENLEITRPTCDVGRKTVI